jgi:hypothetical protein
MPATPASNRATGGLTLITDTTLAADTANFDFTSIQGTFGSLLIVVYVRTARVAVSDSIQMTVNGLGTSIYYDQTLSGAAAAATASEDLGAASGLVGRAPGASATALRFGVLNIWLPGYANTTNHKVWMTDYVTPTGTGSGTITRGTNGGVAAVAAAVSQVTLVGGTGANLLAGSRATLFGVG